MGEDDWDLFAVVRSCRCSSATSSSSTTTTTLLPPDPSSSLTTTTTTTTRNKIDIHEHHSQQELYNNNSNNNNNNIVRPFFPKLNNNNSNSPLVPISPLSVLGGLHDVSPPHKAPQPPLQLPVKRHSVLGGSTNAVVTTTPRSKRRKIQKKMVCQVAAEDLSSDTWSWRKYGQKPIKGSPYPRGYYKCSTSKGCLARKQVERNRSDPGMFIVTYTAEHNHPMPANRSSLSGISRIKPDGPTATTEEKNDEGEEREDFPEADEDDDEFVGSNMVVGDDFFEGLEDFTGSGDGDCLLDHYPDNQTASVAGGGC